jgi:hypothetical protein
MDVVSGKPLPDSRTESDVAGMGFAGLRIFYSVRLFRNRNSSKPKGIRLNIDGKGIISTCFFFACYWKSVGRAGFRGLYLLVGSVSQWT